MLYLTTHFPQVVADTFAVCQSLLGKPRELEWTFHGNYAAQMKAGRLVNWCSAPAGVEASKRALAPTAACDTW